MLLLNTSSLPVRRSSLELRKMVDENCYGLFHIKNTDRKCKVLRAYRFIDPKLFQPQLLAGIIQGLCVFAFINDNAVRLRH